MPSVVQHSAHLAEIIIVDNCSTDLSIKFLHSTYPEIRVISLEKNYGFAEGYNRGIAQIDHELILLLNSDVEATEGWLESLLIWMDAHPNLAAIQPKVLDYTFRSRFEHAGGSGGYFDSLFYVLCRGRVLNVKEDDTGQYDSPVKISWATGAAMLTRRKLFMDLGGFDKDYFAHFEEIDLCWRMQRAGYFLVAEPKSVVYHLGGGTLGYQSPWKVHLNFRNSLYTLMKNESAGKLVLKIPMRFILDGVAGIQFLIKKEVRNCWEIIRAHWKLYRNFGTLLKKRKSYNRLIDEVAVKEEKPKIIYVKGSVLWSFFAKGNKHFNQIADEEQFRIERPI